MFYFFHFLREVLGSCKSGLLFLYKHLTLHGLLEAGNIDQGDHWYKAFTHSDLNAILASCMVLPHRYCHGSYIYGKTSEFKGIPITGSAALM